MSKYKVGDKVVLTVTGMHVLDEDYILNNNFILSEPSTDKYAEPLSTYTEPLEDTIQKYTVKIARLVMEKERLKDENERLKAENEKMSIKIDAYELCGDQHEVEYNQAFNQDAEAAWELAKKCMLMTDRERETIFGSGHNALYGVLTYFDYKHAAAKVAEWEKAKEEIKVGDVVSHEEKYGVVISEGTICFRGFTDDGTPFEWYKERCTKTGRHIDIDSFLKQIGEEQE